MYLNKMQQLYYTYFQSVRSSADLNTVKPHLKDHHEIKISPELRLLGISVGQK